MPRKSPKPGKKTGTLPGLALKENQVLMGKARFTVLGQGLIRMEWAKDRRFEDRASFFALRRDLPGQDFKVWREKACLHIETATLRLEFRDDGRPFSAANLCVAVSPADGHGGALWKPGMPEEGNLGGTLRTLDEVKTRMPLGEGLLSRGGWHVQDDSKNVLFSAGNKGWVEPRRKNGATDWYFFGYGHDYASALKAMGSIGGQIPLPPRYVLGSWYSRYWPYTTDEFLGIAEEYKAKGYPLDVMVIDMDWHEDGWTGYTWNKKLIPDPVRLLSELHQRGLAVTLNLHPHDGVKSHEAAYRRFAKAMGLNPAKKADIPFDVTDPKFMKNYFELLLNPMEKQGVDFWWMDWQQGTSTKIEGLDPLVWLNHLHFKDRQRPAKRRLRGLNFSRWAGVGDHRHPVQFSGDTYSNWEVLSFLVPFTSRGGNVGACWWSHDLGGHLCPEGRVDSELYLRWLQFGAFSPVMRIHSTRDANNDRRPWLYGEEFTRIAREAYLLRARLVPYLYSAARQCHDSGLPLCRPLYLHYPNEEKAYASDQQFLLGEDLLVAPVTAPGEGPDKVVRLKVWFPEGAWYHLATHRKFIGPAEVEIEAGLDYLPVFARGGAPIPLAPEGHLRAGEDPREICVRLYPGPALSRELYEDDGETTGYLDGKYRRTLLRSKVGMDGQMELEAPQSFGSYPGAPKAPKFTLETPMAQPRAMAARS